MYKNKDIKTNRGYTLLFAVLVSSLVLSIGISILNISKKEFLLSTSARDSSLAFYAADGGFECALLGDNIDAFNISTDKTNLLSCNPSMAFSTTHPPAGGTFIFHAKFGSEGNSCARVTVTEITTSGETTKTIESRGYNTGWDSVNKTCNVASPKRVERAIRYSYKY